MDGLGGVVFAVVAVAVVAAVIAVALRRRGNDWAGPPRPPRPEDPVAPHDPAAVQDPPPTRLDSSDQHVTRNLPEEAADPGGEHPDIEHRDLEDPDIDDQGNARR